VTVFDRLGLNVQPLINAAGHVTMYGGATMPPEVLEAMAEASRLTVRVDELQAEASKVIARLTGAEAGYVTCGCSASLTLATAACLTGFDVDRIERLPDTTGMPNEVIIASNQRNAYDHAIRAAGAKIVNAGMPSGPRYPGTYTTIAEDFEAAVNERTVAIAYFYHGGGIPPLEDVIAVAKAHRLPVIVDAADQVPPVENLWKFTAMGADLVCISGGKGIRGPQQSGLLIGRHDLIACAALNHFTPGFGGGYVSYDRWQPPASLIPKERLRAVPRHPIGRGLKVSKEAIVGLLTALAILTDEERLAAQMRRFEHYVRIITESLQGMPGVAAEAVRGVEGGVPSIRVSIDEQKAGVSAAAVVQRLREGSPRVFVFEAQVGQGVITMDPSNLDEEKARALAERLRAAVIGNS